MASDLQSSEVRASAFQSRLLISDCGMLVKCEEDLSTRSATKTNNHLRVPMTSSNTTSNNSNSPKMGSRRIFTPQFKLQVLESYRSDSDCKGNQRATARKYNIHRRQIQKWLQCESNLRSSVANINQNSVKHQFHNISHHQQLSQQAQPPQRLAIPMTAASVTLSSASNGYSHPHHHLPQVSMDTARQALALNSLTVPSMPVRAASSNTTPAQGVLAAANIAAAVAVAIANTSSTNSSTTVVSPLRPTAIGGNGGGGSSNPVAAMSASMLHPHHNHHHYSMSPYTHSPVATSVPVTVPMLTHHIAPPPQHHALHQHYTYHNLSSHTHTHSLPLSHQPSAFLPSACLPVNVLSAVAAASPPANAASSIPPIAPPIDIRRRGAEENGLDANEKAKLSETIQETTTKTISTAPLEATSNIPVLATFSAGSVRSYVYATEYDCMYNSGTHIEGESMRDAKSKNFLQQPSYLYAEQPSSSATMSSPIDLSTRRKSQECNEFIVDASSRLLRTKDKIGDNYECHLQEGCDNTNATDVVDLTFRKRKVIAANTLTADTEQPQKLAKRTNNADIDNEIATNTSADDETVEVVTSHDNNDSDDDEVEIQVEVDEEAKLLSSKPVKLFKPYLLDEADNGDQSPKSHQSSGSQLNMGEQREPIIWSNHPACLSRFGYDGSAPSDSRASSIPSPLVDNNTFPKGSPHFPSSKPSSPQSVLSPTSEPSVSPTNFSLRCPKGSPVSGYESSSSTCSERDDHYSLTENRSFSLDFQMHAVCSNKIMPQQIHIRKWLDQDENAETNTPPLTRASIALYA